MFDTALANHEYMQFVLTHNCNRVCKFCIDHKRGADEYMQREALERGLDFAAERGVREILFIGGEPTLHPQFREFCRAVGDRGLQLIVTTNFDELSVVESNADVVNSWNLSYYGQKQLPNFPVGTDVTISGLIYAKGFLNTQEKLDSFIDLHGADYSLKFSTLSVINDYTAKTVDPGSWIDELEAEWVWLFDFIPAQLYRGTVIKRYDLPPSDSGVLDSYKCLVDGAVTRSWIDRGDSEVERVGALKLEELLSPFAAR